MKSNALYFILFISLFAVTGLQAQTAEEIINKHIEAIGGREKLNAVRSLYMEGEFSAPGIGGGAATGSAKISLLNGKGLREDYILPHASSIGAYTTTGGWRIVVNNESPLGPDNLNAGKSRLTFGGPLLNYKENGGKVELVGKETIGDVETFHIKLLTKDDIEFSYWIDPQTYYITKMVIRSAKGEVFRSEQFTDYKKTEAGIVLAYASEFAFNGSNTFFFLVNKVEVNKEIDASVFDKPKK